MFRGVLRVSPLPLSFSKAWGWPPTKAKNSASSSSSLTPSSGIIRPSGERSTSRPSCGNNGGSVIPWDAPWLAGGSYDGPGIPWGGTQGSWESQSAGTGPRHNRCPKMGQVTPLAQINMGQRAGRERPNCLL